MIGKRLSASADGVVITGEVVASRSVKGVRHARVRLDDGRFVLIPWTTAQRLVLGYACTQLAKATEGGST